jgi:hypothetical protein
MQESTTKLIDKIRADIRHHRLREKDIFVSPFEKYRLEIWLTPTNPSAGTREQDSTLKINC